MSMVCLMLVGEAPARQQAERNFVPASQAASSRTHSGTPYEIAKGSHHKCLLAPGLNDFETKEPDGGAVFHDAKSVGVD